MRKISFLFCLLTLASCSLFQDQNDNGFEEKMSALVNENMFESEDVTYSYTDGQLMIIQGTAADSSKIILRIDSLKKEGIYPLSNSQRNEATYISVGQTEYSSKSTLKGNIYLSYITQTEIEGTFFFDAKNGGALIVVLEGTFSAKRK